nr:phosphatidylinositol binding clathrin assembly [Hymenolepis microstoma]
MNEPFYEVSVYLSVLGSQVFLEMTAKMAGKMAKQLAGSGTGQSLMDRVTQAKYSLAGSALGKVIAKASTEELIAPKKKHLENLVRMSNEPNVSIPLLVNFLLERTREKSWVVVFKALITTHHLLNYGNEKISQYMASNSTSFHLPHFNDKSSSQSYEMSLFIRKYSKYLLEKTKSYQLMAFDFCKVKRGKNDGVMRIMPADKLLKALPALRDQLNVLFEFEATEKDLNNLIINSAYILLYKDLIRLFASYNEGMMNLVEKYFSMKRSQCKTALELYQDFPNIMTKVDEFLTVAEHLGIGDKESMGLHPVPPQILEAMEQHLALLQKKKKPNGQLDDEDEEPAKTAEEHHASTKPPLPKSRPHASPAHPKSPARPGTSPKVTTAKARPVEQESNTALLATLADLTSTPDLSHVPLRTEVIVTDPDGEQKEPEEEGSDGLPANEEGDEHEGDEEKDESMEETRREEEEYEEDEQNSSGLPSEQQQAIIAAATSHFIQSADRTNQAVKSSVALTPRQTRKFTNEPEGGDAARVVSSSRSRSPSPARPPPPHIASSVYPTPSSVHSSPVHEKPEPEAKADIAIDDLLGFGDDIPITQPSPSIQFVTSISKPPATSESKPHSALDDLLSLDPLLDTGSDSTPVPMPAVSSTSESTGLPAGLKPAPADVVVRPAVVIQKKKENALDQLDTTLASLASSLGGSSSNWGTGTTSKNK